MKVDTITIVTGITIFSNLFIAHTNAFTSPYQKLTSTTISTITKYPKKFILQESNINNINIIPEEYETEVYLAEGNIPDGKFRKRRITCYTIASFVFFVVGIVDIIKKFGIDDLSMYYSWMDFIPSSENVWVGSIDILVALFFASLMESEKKDRDEAALLIWNNEYDQASSSPSPESTPYFMKPHKKDILFNPSFLNTAPTQPQSVISDDATKGIPKKLALEKERLAAEETRLAAYRKIAKENIISVESRNKEQERENQNLNVVADETINKTEIEERVVDKEETSLPSTVTYSLSSLSSQEPSTFSISLSPTRMSVPISPAPLSSYSQTSSAPASSNISTLSSSNSDESVSPSLAFTSSMSSISHSLKVDPSLITSAAPTSQQTATTEPDCIPTIPKESPVMSSTCSSDVSSQLPSLNAPVTPTQAPVSANIPMSISKTTTKTIAPVTLLETSSSYLSSLSSQSIISSSSKLSTPDPPLSYLSSLSSQSSIPSSLDLSSLPTTLSKIEVKNETPIDSPPPILSKKKENQFITKDSKAPENAEHNKFIEAAHHVNEEFHDEIACKTEIDPQDTEKYETFIASVHAVNADFCDEITNYAENVQRSANDIALSISQTSSSWATGKIMNEKKLNREEVERRMLLLKKTLNHMDP